MRVIKKYLEPRAVVLDLDARARVEVELAPPERFRFLPHLVRTSGLQGIRARIRVRLIDFVHDSTLGLRVLKKKKARRDEG